MNDNPILWEPDDERVRSTAMYRFMNQHSFDTYFDLHQWSIDQPAAFWQALCDFCDIRFSKPAVEVLTQPGDMATAKWFDGSQLSFAENLLRHSGGRAAVISRTEDGKRSELSFDELRQSVADIAESLRLAGVVKGDRIVGYLPNCPEAIVAMLASASIGAIWSSCSPDFGFQGVVDRFGQIRPKVLFCIDSYSYNGTIHKMLNAVKDIVNVIDCIEHTVIVPFSSQDFRLDDIRGAIRWNNFAAKNAALEFTQVEFDHPLYIMYSSGTTGIPKCIVHGVGGTLLQHQKEHVLHVDINERDRLFYFTTCGWMMWNWMVSTLATGATLYLYDGSPFLDDGRILWKMAEQERLTVFGTSAKFISALEKSGVRPKDEFALPNLKVLLSTGSPLAPESFNYVYDAIAENMQLSSISGGTDILSCFAIGNPILPVHRGELQCLGLGMAVDIFTDTGESVKNESGELVCTKAFPSMPVGFWNDPDNRKYHAAYFDRFPGVWAHGDYAEITDRQSMVISGRSDALLNPGGIRIGTSEIYRQVEKLNEILESIAIGQDWGDDVRTVLFVVLREGVDLDEKLIQEICGVIRENTTPRHVPAKVVAVPEIPRTISGKIVELAVRSVVHGEEVKNLDALANPSALEYFRDLAELQTK